MSALAFRDVQVLPQDLAPGASPEAKRSEPLLAGLNLSLERGALLALLGESGGGKSTLLKLANRLIDPSAGEVEVLGRPAKEWPLAELRRNALLVPSAPSSFGGTLADELEVGLTWQGRRAEPEALRATLELLGLGELELERSGERLSGGQRTRVALGRALLLEPPLLLLDEPSSALDVRAARELFGRLRGWLKERQGSALVVTHRPADVGTLECPWAALLGGVLYGPYPAKALLDPPHEAVAAFLGGLEDP